MTTNTPRPALLRLDPALVACCSVSLVALALAGFMVWGSEDFCLDDAWIHLAYARSLRLGDGFSYNPGDRETGFSSPLWVMLLSLLPGVASGEPLVSVKLLGVFGHVLLTWGTARLGAALAAPAQAPLATWVGGLLAACDPLLLFASGSGMEVTLTAALIVWTLLGICRGALRLPILLAAASVWARPESLFILAPFCLLQFRSTRRASAWLPLASAALAMLAWVAYCLWVSGHPWPNTYYAKRGGNFAQGSLYVLAQVLPAQAWFLGLTGIWLFARGLRRAGPARSIVLATLIAFLAVAASRDVILGIQFYCSRYFAVFCALPCAVVASQLPERRLWRGLALLPILVANAYLLPEARALQRIQETNIQTLHTEPARYLARTLPRAARVAVEGAGTVRYFLGRSIWVIDVVGLNARRIVHEAGQGRVCAVLAERPTHVLLPDDYYQAYSGWLELRPSQRFVDKGYAMSLYRIERGVVAARVLGPTPFARSACR